MSNLIPPLLSSSPPPITGPLDEEDDDEFGDFRAADSYDCDDFSLPSSPQKSPEKSDFSKVNLDINSNNSQKIQSTTEMPTNNISEPVEKDFQDRRKTTEDESGDLKLCENEVNCSNSQSATPSNVFDIHNNQTLLNEHSEVSDQQQNLNEKPVKTDFGASDDQIIANCSNAIKDDFPDLECGVPSSITNCDETKPNDDSSGVEVGTVQILNGSQNNSNSFSNEENLFEDFSESVQLEKTDSDALSDLNEIKSEEEINFEITNEVDAKDASKDCENSESSMSLKVCETDPKLSDDEFGDFEDHFVNETEAKPETDANEAAFEDEFDDFVSPASPPRQKVANEDDFGDFESSDLTKAEFEDFGDVSAHADSGCEKPPLMEIDVKNAFVRSEITLKDIFPVAEEEIGNFEYFDETEGNSIFDGLKDVTETNALHYQWSKSNSQKMFLKALNIDMRNILYGPAWNCSMPRFAANLGLTPLQPVKTEILTPTPVQNVPSPSNSSQKTNGDIPTAQFDWSGSGLINPLDSTSTEPPGSAPEDSSQSHVKTDFLPEKSESVPTLFESESLPQPTKDQTNAEVGGFELPKPSVDQSDDFSPFHSPKMMIPLRETHISNETINDCGSKPGWLEPTILTPDLPRKEPVVVDDDDDDDEFDDFQMVLPEERKAVDVKEAPFPDPSEFDASIKTVNKPNQEHIFAIPPSQSSLFDPVRVDDDDDEFTDFHSSVPPPRPPSEILTPLRPVPVEPLKPSVRYTPPVATQINWPDPGVTDEDVRNIELSYSRKTEPNPAEKQPEVGKESSADDDEWSDFVSVTNPVKPERTATPDLPLSVLNLNHVQASKQPIPVITPTGLVQTKLSSNLQPKSSNVVQTTLQPFRPSTTAQFQPSTISSQFAASSKMSQDDDDDWSEFVSGQLPPQVANGYQQKFNQKPSQWTNATTNIIMNPTHFDSFQGYVPQQKKAARSAIPSISAMPDLDFIAPKNRTKK